MVGMTFVVGLSVRTTSGCAHLRGVLMESRGLDDVTRRFEHRASQGDPVEQQLHGIGQALATELRAQEIDAAAIREAGFSRNASLRQAVAKNRLRAEGIVLTQARSFTERVALADVQGLSHLLNLSPGDLDARSEAILPDPWADTVSAALAARGLV